MSGKLLPQHAASLQEEAPYLSWEDSGYVLVNTMCMACSKCEGFAEKVYLAPSAEHPYGLLLRLEACPCGEARLSDRCLLR